MLDPDGCVMVSPLGCGGLYLISREEDELCRKFAKAYQFVLFW
jgi:hypothetical protein